MKQYIKKKFCEKCDKDVDAILSRVITTSGISRVYWHCNEHDPKRGGDIKNNGNAISHKLVKQANIDIEELPITDDYRFNTFCSKCNASIFCYVCGSPGVEYHHWGPKHLFGDDADKWPTAYLCYDCHQKWHNIVTPGMYKK